MRKEDFTTIEDVCTHYGEDYHNFLGAVVPPIFQNSLFVDPYKGERNGDSDEKRYGYTRISNPNFEVAEEKIAVLEHGEAALCFSSGMAAISTAIFYWIQKDCHVIMIKNVYGPTYGFVDLCAKFGVEITTVTGESIEEFERAIRPNTKLIYLESPSTFTFSLQDLREVAKLAKAYGIGTIVDNSWASPIFQNPLDFGIDMVVHSASKYLGGHSDIIGGVIISKKDIIDIMIGRERALLGGIMDPHQAWLLTRSLRTLPIRMGQHQENGMKMAEFLESHPKVSRVMYPGLKSHPQYDLGKKQLKGYSGLMSFIINGNPDEVITFVNSLEYFQRGPSWGGFESLIAPVGVGINEETAQRTGIPQGLIRISVGLENIDTLINCIDKGLDHIER